MPKPKKPKTGRYDHLTTEQIYEKLEEILDRENASELLTIPGIYEILVEHFNNEILDELVPEEDERGYAIPDYIPPPHA